MYMIQYIPYIHYSFKIYFTILIHFSGQSEKPSRNLPWEHNLVRFLDSS